MMKLSAPVRAIVIVAITFAFLGALIVANPFSLTTAVMVRAFGAAPAWTELKVRYLDPATQETTIGDDPLASFHKLAAIWGGHDKRRIYLIGNSQMYHIVLSPGERPPAVPQKTYPDLLADYYAQTSKVPVSIYRLAAPNISYPEVLWYSIYISSEPSIKPDAIVLQLNYEAFRKSGIRDGMLRMLDDASFRAKVEAIAASDRSYAGEFREALTRYKFLQTTAKSSDAAEKKTAESAGDAIETQARVALNRIDATSDKQRHQLRFDALEVLYLLRVYLLNVRPTTPRSLLPNQFKIDLDALNAVFDICREGNIEVVLLNAPQNPAASLYRTEADKELYHRTIRELADKNRNTLIDLEGAVPEKYWGVWIDGRDPIHFGLDGHREMARKVIESKLVDGVLR